MFNGLPIKIKYLTNKDLLEEIHISKKTYCDFVDPKYSNYDIIVDDLNKVSQNLLDEARKKKVTQEISRRKKEMIAKGIRNPIINFTLDDVPQENIVIRLMTFDHIPINKEKLHKAKTEADRHIKCNFPPFQHFIIRDNEFYCVGKSHWQGGMENGCFNIEHGHMTNKLALMFMKLVERYGHRGNWRGYCISSDTKAMTQRGWLDIDEINENDIILSYDQGYLKWSTIKSIYRGYYEGPMWHLITDNMDALITPEHKMVTLRGIIKMSEMSMTDTIILMGNSTKSTLNFDQYEYKTINFLDIVLSGGLNVKIYNGMVWCPETEYGCFIARRNGKVYLTGNTYLDEMKNQALLQLSQIGLQFDESRSDTPNPFAYYTAAITNSFTRVLNIEKKNQNIRDDLLTMHGATPSYTRVTDDEIAAKKLAANFTTQTSKNSN
jgi:hypothetical protein